MQKRLVAILMTLALVVPLLLIQQIPTNVEAKNSNDPLINPSQLFTDAAAKEDCECSTGEFSNKSYEKMDVVKDKKIINTLSNQLNSWESQGVSYYKTSDFKWDETTLTKYNDQQHALIVPLNNVSKNKVIFLLAGYEPDTNQLLNPILMEFTKRTDNNNVDKVDYKTLDNNAVAGFKFSDDGEYLQKIVYDNSSVNDENGNNLNGYWDNVANCIRTTWGTLPSWLQTACESACFSVVFGGNAIGVTLCASCLTGHVMDCMMRG